MIKVLIADDQAIVRTGLTMLLDAQPDIDVVGAAADGREARTGYEVRTNFTEPVEVGDDGGTGHARCSELCEQLEVAESQRPRVEARARHRPRLAPSPLITYFAANESRISGGSAVRMRPTATNG